jgi:hypothetical protein
MNLNRAHFSAVIKTVDNDVMACTSDKFDVISGDAQLLGIYLHMINVPPQSNRAAVNIPTSNRLVTYTQEFVVDAANAYPAADIIPTAVVVLYAMMSFNINNYHCVPKEIKHTIIGIHIQNQLSSFIICSAIYFVKRILL